MCDCVNKKFPIHDSQETTIFIKIFPYAGDEMWVIDILYILFINIIRQTKTGFK